MAKLFTWGTGAAFGRVLGVSSSSSRNSRGHTASSIIDDTIKQKVHYLIDAGAPCVEKIIDSGIPEEIQIPDILFFTHSHPDHTSDFDKLVNSVKRGRLFNEWGNEKICDKPEIKPLYVICTNKCLNDPLFGLKTKFSYLEGAIQWITIPSYDVWFSIRKSDGELVPTKMISRKNEYHSIEFKALPVNHGPTAPGSSLYIFRFEDETGIKKVVISGDFESIKDSVINNPDLSKPHILLLETNTIKAVGTNHTNLLQNLQLIYIWKPRRVLLNHISGFEDWEQCYFKFIPDSKDWISQIKAFKPPLGVNITIAGDGKIPVKIVVNGLITVNVADDGTIRFEIAGVGKTTIETADDGKIPIKIVDEKISFEITEDGKIPVKLVDNGLISIEVADEEKIPIEIAEDGQSYEI